MLYVRYGIRYGYFSQAVTECKSVIFYCICGRGKMYRSYLSVIPESVPYDYSNGILLPVDLN